VGSFVRFPPCQLRRDFPMVSPSFASSRIFVSEFVVRSLPSSFPTLLASVSLSLIAVLHTDDFRRRLSAPTFVFPTRPFCATRGGEICTWVDLRARVEAVVPRRFACDMSCARSVWSWTCSFFCAFSLPLRREGGGVL
jgi:hypothetical protein